MSRVPILIAVALVALLVAGVGGSYAYDSSRDDVIAEGVTVGDVDVGGLTAGEASARLDAAIRRPLLEPVRVRVRGERYRLTAEEARVRADVEGMVADALAASRDGSFLTRSWRDLTGGSVDVAIPARIAYSRRAVADLVNEVEEDVEREAVDATVEPSLGGLVKTPAEKGIEVFGDRLERDVRAELETAEGNNRVTARTRTVEPEVTAADLAQQYPHYLIVDRGARQLHYYEGLEHAETYTVSVGQAGHETPVGLYDIQNKAVDPAWSVPNAAWAGDLAGQTIPGGAPNNPLRERWLGIYDGAGIHGTDATSSLGGAESHGCIRMAIPDVIELYDRVPVGTPVYIQ